MSSISAKIRALSSSNPDNIQVITNSLIESLNSRSFSDSEMVELCDCVNQMVKNPVPSNVRYAFTLCKEILSKNYPHQFPLALLGSMQNVLSNTNKFLRENSIEIANVILEKMGPESFWENFGISLSSKSNPLKESGLRMMKSTVDAYPDFKLGKLCPIVFQLIEDSSPDVRKAAISVSRVLYDRKPSTVESMIEKQFKNNFKEIISRISSEKKVSAIPEGSYAASSNQQQMTVEEIERQIIIEFETPFSDIKLDSSSFSFNDISTKLSRKSDWKERMETLKSIIAHAKGSPKKDAFLRDFRVVQDTFVDCLTDARSTLCKHACQCFVALAQFFGPDFDTYTDFTFPPLFSRCSHATQVISLSSRLALERCVDSVYGKRTKANIVMASSNASPEVRLAAAKCMNIAIQKWPAELSFSFKQSLAELDKDPSDIVRTFVHNRPIDLHEVLEDSTSEIVDSLPSLDQAITDRDTKSLINILETKQPIILGSILSIVDILIMEMNEQSGYQISIELLEVLTTYYPKQIHPYVIQIIKEIPDDNPNSLNYLEQLSNIYGDLIIARLLLGLESHFSISFLMQVAHNNLSDSEFCIKVLYKVLSKHLFIEYHDRVIFILKKIYSKDSCAVESLLSAIPSAEREELLQDIRMEIPQLYDVFVSNDTASMPQRAREVYQEAVNGKEISAEFLELAVDQDIRTLLMTIASVRESKLFKNEYIPFLMRCLVHKDVSINGAASLALQIRCEENPNCSLLIAEHYKPSSLALKSFARSLKFSTKKSIEKALEIMKVPLQEALSNISLKHSALSVLACATLITGQEIDLITGQISDVNRQIFQAILETEKTIETQ